MHKDYIRVKKEEIESFFNFIENPDEIVTRLHIQRVLPVQYLWDLLELAPEALKEFRKDHKKLPEYMVCKGNTEIGIGDITYLSPPGDRKMILRDKVGIDLINKIKEAQVEIFIELMKKYYQWVPLGKTLPDILPAKLTKVQQILVDEAYYKLNQMKATASFGEIRILNHITEVLENKVSLHPSSSDENSKQADEVGRDKNFFASLKMEKVYINLIARKTRPSGTFQDESKNISKQNTLAQLEEMIEKGNFRQVYIFLQTNKNAMNITQSTGFFKSCPSAELFKNLQKIFEDEAKKRDELHSPKFTGHLHN